MSDLSEEVVRIARTWERTPYRHQASVKGIACDCLGLARGVWREIYDSADPEKVPAYSADWAEASGEEMLLEAARRHMVLVAEGSDPEAVLAAAEPGDLLIMRWRPHLPAKHCVILTEKGADGLPFGWRIIHAYDAAKRVAEVTLAPQWRKRIVAAFRFPALLTSRSGLRPSPPLEATPGTPAPAPSPCPSPTFSLTSGTPDVRAGEGTKTAAPPVPSPLTGEGGPKGRVRGESAELQAAASGAAATGTQQEAGSGEAATGKE